MPHVAENQLVPPRTASHTKFFPMGGHTNLVYSLAWSPDGKPLATGSFDQTAKVWDVASGQEVATFGSGERLVTWENMPSGEELLAESHLTRPLFGSMVRRIATLPLTG